MILYARVKILSIFVTKRNKRASIRRNRYSVINGWDQILDLGVFIIVTIRFKHNLSRKKKAMKIIAIKRGRSRVSQIELVLAHIFCDRDHRKQLYRNLIRPVFPDREYLLQRHREHLR